VESNGNFYRTLKIIINSLEYDNCLEKNMNNKYQYPKSSMKRKLVALFFIFLFLSCSPLQLNNALIPSDKMQEKWWKNRHEKLLNSKNTNPQLLLIGNSILNTLDEKDRKDIWEKHLNKYNTFNMGFSGDRTENVIWRLQNGELDNIDPRVALVLIGTNNTDGNNFPTINYPNEIEEATWKICEIIKEKLPKIEILLLAILPFGEYIPNYRNTIIERTNKLLAKFPNRDKSIHFVNIGSLFLSKNGDGVNLELMHDGLHPSAEGHMLMFDHLEVEITKLMRK